MFMRKTAILSIALLAVALAGCGKKEEHAPETTVAPETQAPMTAPTPAPEQTPPPATMDQAPATTDPMAPSDGTMTTPPPADGTKAPE